MDDVTPDPRPLPEVTAAGWYRQGYAAGTGDLRRAIAKDMLLFVPEYRDDEVGIRPTAARRLRAALAPAPVPCERVVRDSVMRCLIHGDVVNCPTPYRFGEVTR